MERPDSQPVAAPSRVGLITLWHQRTLIAVSMLLAVLAALAYSLSLPEVYTASTSVIVRPVLVRGGLEADPLAGAEQEALDQETSIETQAEVLRSRDLLSLLVERDIPPEERLSLAVDVQPVTPEILEVLVTGDSPRAAAAIANGLVDSYLEERRSSVSQALLDAAGELAERQAEVATEIEAVDAQLALANSSSAQRELSALRTELIEEHAELIRDRGRLEADAGSVVGGGLVVRRAAVPAVPSSPVPQRDVLVGLLLGGLLGVGLGLLREHTQPRVRTRDDAAAAAGSSVLASVPARITSTRGSVGGVAHAAGFLQASLATRGFGRQFRRLCVVSVDRSTRTGGLVTATAVAAARAGVSTIVVEAAPGRRRAPFGASFGGSDPGTKEEGSLASLASLADVAAGRRRIAEALADTEIEGMKVLRADDLATIGHEDLDQVFSAAELGMQAIIVEAPAADEGPEVSVLLGVCEAALLVATAGTTYQADLVRAAHLAAVQDVPVVGVVLIGTSTLDRTAGIAPHAVPWPADRALRTPDRGLADGDGDGAVEVLPTQFVRSVGHR